MIKLKIKRIFDVVASASFLVILCPLFLLIATAIKFTSKGPVLFKQDRLGYKGKVYKILKFRTMVVDAEKKGLGLAVTADDKRITKVGRFLRRTSIDELPQLINVLNGEMSIVGPRPPATYYPFDGYEKYPRWAKKRFEFKPGITGYAQVKGRNNINWDEKIKLDIKYVNHWSLGLDIKIIVQTFVNVIKRKDIYEAENKKMEAVFNNKGRDI